MPVLDGHEAAKEIIKLAQRENFRSSHRRSSLDCSSNPISDLVNIVAVTAYTSEEVKEKSYRVGMKMVVPKPVPASLLKEVINKYFKK